MKAVAQACARRNMPPSASGSTGAPWKSPLLEKYGGVTPQAMVDSAFGHIALLNRYDFDDICVSLKASSVPITMGAYTLMHQQSDYPLHLGVTEAGHHPHGDAEGCRRRSAACWPWGSGTPSG